MEKNSFLPEETDLPWIFFNSEVFSTSEKLIVNLHSMFSTTAMHYLFYSYDLPRFHSEILVFLNPKQRHESLIKKDRF